MARTNEEYVTEINQLLTDFVNGKHGMFDVSIPEEEINDILNMIYLTANRLVGDKRMKYQDTWVMHPEREKDYIQ